MSYKLLVFIVPSSLPQLEAHHVSGRKQTERNQTKLLTLGTWNVRTLLDRKDKQKITDFRSERRTALVSKELSRYKIDIAALSETRLADTGELKEVVSCYTSLLEMKVGSTEARIEGGGLCNLIQPCTSIGRSAFLRMQLDKDRYATMISVPP